MISRGQDHLAKKVSDEMREQSFVTAYHPDFPLFRKLAHKNVDLHLTQNACESLIIGEFVKRMLKSHAAVVQSIYPYIDTLAHCELFKRI